MKNINSGIRHYTEEHLQDEESLRVCRSCQQEEEQSQAGISGDITLNVSEMTKVFKNMSGVCKVKTVNPEDYARRIRACHSCDGFIPDNGGMCRYCGCDINIKAKLAAAKCSYPYISKWNV